MTWPDPEEIPKSIIKGSGVIHADFGPLGEDGRLLFVSPICVLIGLRDQPYMLLATPQFSAEDLIRSTGKNIYEVKRLLIQRTFSVDEMTRDEHCAIPGWTTSFDKIEELKLDSIIINDLSTLKALPIQRLILSKIKVDNAEKLADEINQFKDLKYLSYDESFPLGAIEVIRKSNSALIILPEKDYYTLGL